MRSSTSRWRLVGEPGGIRRRLVGGASWSVAGAAASRGLGLIGTVLVARLLVPHRFGQLSLIQLAVLLLTSVAGLGLRTAATKRIAETRDVDRQRAGRQIGFIILMTSVMAAIVAGGYLLAGQWVASHLLLDDRLDAVVALSAGIVFATSISSAQLGILTGFEAFRNVALLQTVESLLDCALMVVGVVLGGLAGSVLGWLLGEVITLAMGFILIDRTCVASGVRVCYRVLAAEWDVLWDLGLPMLAAGIAVLVALLLSQRLLAAQSRGLADLAAFNVAYRWELVVVFIPSAVAPIMLPILSSLRASGRADQIRRIFRLNMTASVALTLVPAALVMVLGHQLLGLTGHFYSAQTTVLAVLLVTAIPIVVNNVLSQTALSLGAVAAWMVSDLVLAAVLLAVAVALVPGHGATGLGFAYLAGYVATDVVLAWPVCVRLSAIRRSP